MHMYAHHLGVKKIISIHKICAIPSFDWTMHVKQVCKKVAEEMRSFIRHVFDRVFCLFPADARNIQYFSH